MRNYLEDSCLDSVSHYDFEFHVTQHHGTACHIVSSPMQLEKVWLLVRESSVVHVASKAYSTF